MIKYFFDYYDKIPKGYETGLFTIPYFLTLLIIASILFLIITIFKNKSEVAKRRLLICLSFFLPLLELTRIIWFIGIDRFRIAESLPLHLCGLMSIFMPIAVLTQKQWLKEFVYAGGTLGAISALTYPFVNIYPPVHFLYIQAMLVHATILFIPILMIKFKMLKPNIKSLPVSFIILCILAGGAHILNLKFNGNFFFTMKPVTDTPLYFLYDYTGYLGYLGLFILFVLIVWVLLYLPFTIKRKQREGTEEIEKQEEIA